MSTEKFRQIVRAFIISEFGYCLLTLMNHYRNMNKNVNSIQGKALQFMHKDTTSDLPTLPYKDKSVSIHVQNLQLLMIEMLKSIDSSNLTFLRDLFLIAEQKMLVLAKKC